MARGRSERVSMTPSPPKDVWLDMALVDWRFKMGLRNVQRILVTPCEAPGLAVSIERARLC